MPTKFKLNQPVHAIKSGKSGVVEAIFEDAKGIHYDVRCGEAKGRAHRYAADQLESEAAAKKRKAANDKAAKPVKAVKAAKPVKAVKKAVKKSVKPVAKK